MSLIDALKRLVRVERELSEIEEEIGESVFGPERHPWLIVDTGVDRFAVQLIPHRKVHLMTTVNLGHTITYTIAFLDQNGNPMLTTPTPDAAPTWSNTTPSTATLAANGLTATETPVAVGTDTVDVSLAVSGVTFSASDAVTVAAAPQVLTSIQLVATVN